MLYLNSNIKKREKRKYTIKTTKKQTNKENKDEKFALNFESFWNGWTFFSKKLLHINGLEKIIMFCQKPFCILLKTLFLFFAKFSRAVFHKIKINIKSMINHFININPSMNVCSLFSRYWIFWNFSGGMRLWKNLLLNKKRLIGLFNFFLFNSKKNCRVFFYLLFFLKNYFF